MKKSLPILLLLAFLLLALPCAAAETDDAQDQAVALVNGEALLQSDYATFENSYLTTYANAGYDIDEETIRAYVQDLALTAAIEDMLVKQDMTAQGCDIFDEATEAWLVEQGTAAYESALADVGEALRDALGLADDDDVSPYALSYANTLGVTAQDYIDVYRTQYATMNYYAWLTADNPVTDEDVQSAYEERVSSSRALYEHDAAAFETAVSAGEEIWFKPAGYRSILQILLPAEGETDEERLASVQDTVDEIYTRLEGGEPFEALIAEFGADSALENEDFPGYQVHRDSVLWEDAFVSAAFSDEMQQPGDISRPFSSALGVHILYYLADSESGPVEMTDSVRDALTYSIYQERCLARLNERVDELADSAEVILY